MSSLNLLIATMQADGRLPKSPCAKIEKLKKTEKATREKRIKVEKSAKKQRSKAIEKLTAKVKREVHEIDDTYGKPGKPLKCSTPKPTKAATKKRAKRATITTKDSAALQRGIKAEQKEHGHGKKTARQIAADHLAEDPHFYDDSAMLRRGTKVEQKGGHSLNKARQIAADNLGKDPHFYDIKASRKGVPGTVYDPRFDNAAKADMKRAKEEETKAKAEIKRAAAAKAKRSASEKKRLQKEIAEADKAEAAAAKKNLREDKANLAAKKKAAKKQAKAGAYRPQVAPESPKAEKPPKAPRQKRSPRIDLPPPQSRSEVFVADTAATDAAKTERAMQGFDDIVARQIARMRAANGPTVESMPRRRAMY